MLKNSDWFIKFKPKHHASIRLFCFHYAGGSALVFRDWEKDIIGDAELVAIQLPGRDNRYDEPLLCSISQVVDQLIENFNNYIYKPFVFFGHSMGALIAFEFARALRRKRISQPKHLIVAGTRAPQIFREKQPIHDLPDVEFIKELKKYNGIPSPILYDKEFISTFLPIIRSDFCISETYEYMNEQSLNCPITALGGLIDNTFNKENLLKWKEQTIGSFKYYFLSGDHFFIKFSYKEVIKIINQTLLISKR